MAAERGRRQLSWGQPLYNLLYVARDHLLLLLLLVDHLQPRGRGRQHEEVRRLHPGHPSGQADRRVHRPHPDAADLRRRASTWRRSRAAGAPDQRLQGRRHPVHRRRPWTRFLPAFITQGLGIKFYFGGTSLLIVVGVAMDTVQQIESQLVMRHYDGFLQEGTDPWTALEQGHARPPDRLPRPPQLGQGHAGGRSWRRRSGIPRDLDRRHAPRRGGGGIEPRASGSKGVMARGELVDDELMAEVVRERLAQDDARRGLPPRRLSRGPSPQAATLDEILGGRPTSSSTAWCLIDAPEEVLVDAGPWAAAAQDDTRRDRPRAAARLSTEDGAADRVLRKEGSPSPHRWRPIDERRRRAGARRPSAPRQGMIVFKTAGELELMDEANALVHRVLDGIAERIAPGVTTARARPLGGGDDPRGGRRAGVPRLQRLPGDAVHRA